MLFAFSGGRERRSERRSISPIPSTGWRRRKKRDFGFLILWLAPSRTENMPEFAPGRRWFMTPAVLPKPRRGLFWPRCPSSNVRDNLSCLGTDALARLGRRLSARRGGVFSGADSYEDIVLAADHFSKTATGALIIIEREIGLRTFIESGVPLDANLSYDLLITIFRPSAPLHDGAVIVQKGRIAAAACFLPLSMNPVLSTQYGTRHRAAIGITEETDAISVVVSEETGSISLAVAGAIERDITVEYLRERLSEVLRRYVPTATLPTTITDRELSTDERGIEHLSRDRDLADGAER